MCCLCITRLAYIYIFFVWSDFRCFFYLGAEEMLSKAAVPNDSIEIETMPYIYIYISKVSTKSKRVLDDPINVMCNKGLILYSNSPLKSMHVNVLCCHTYLHNAHQAPNKVCNQIDLKKKEQNWYSASYWMQWKCHFYVFDIFLFHQWWIGWPCNFSSNKWRT